MLREIIANLLGRVLLRLIEPAPHHFALEEGCFLQHHADAAVALVGDVRAVASATAIRFDCPAQNGHRLQALQRAPSPDDECVRRVAIARAEWVQDAAVMCRIRDRPPVAELINFVEVPINRRI